MHRSFRKTVLLLFLSCKPCVPFFLNLCFLHYLYVGAPPRPLSASLHSRSAKDLFMATMTILGATAKGAAGVGKGLATFATDAQSAPAEV